MHLAFGARSLAAGGLGVAVFATAAAGLALSGGPGPDGPVAASRTQAEVVISPGTVRLRREAKRGPSDTRQCQQAFHIECYNPAQIQQAYHLPALYSGFSAASGYSLAAGLGTVNAAAFVPELARLAG